MKKNYFVKLKTAKLAKKKGFDLPVRRRYWPNVDYLGELTLSTADNINRNSTNGDSISAPTQSELQDWLMENYKIYVAVGVYATNPIQFHVGIFSEEEDAEIERLTGFTDWFKALEKGLRYALKCIETDK